MSPLPNQSRYSLTGVDPVVYEIEDSSTGYPGYPSAATETMFGTVLLPKLWGKNLTSLEIASSGSIILSVKDVVTLEITHDGSETTISGQSANSINIDPQDTYRTTILGDHKFTTETMGDKSYLTMRTGETGGHMISNDLTVTGATNFIGAATFNGETFGITADSTEITSSTIVNGTLSVAQSTTLASTLSVAQATTLASTLSVTGATTMENTLSVAQATTLASTLSVAQATTLASTLSVTQATTLGSTLSVAQATTLGSTLSVAQATTLGNTLSVNGRTTLENTLSVAQATTLTSTLSVTGATTLGSTLSVGGVTNLKNTTVQGKLTINGDIEVSGTFNSTSIDATTLNIEDYMISLNSGEDNNEINTTTFLGDEDGMGIEISGDYNIETIHPNTFKPQYAEHGANGAEPLTFATFVNENGFHEKSIKWKGSSGLHNSAHFVDSVSPEDESCWEFRGGGIRMSQKIFSTEGGVPTDMKDVSFSFRVNASEELEIWKGVIGFTSEVRSFTRVARFGAGANLANT